MSSIFNLSNWRSKLDLTVPIDRNLKSLISKKLDHWSVTCFMMLLTLYALFGDNFRILFTNKDSDEFFYYTTCLVMGIFTLEILILSIVKEGYIFSFYFWLDVFSTISMLTDIGWAWDAMVGTDTTTGRTNTSSSQFARATRVSRAGTRSARIIKIVRVVRLIRIFKLYKISEETKTKILKNNEFLFRKNTLTDRNIRNSIDYTAEESQIIESNDETDRSFTFGNKSQNPCLAKRTTQLTRIFPTVKELGKNKTLQTESEVGKKLSELTTKKVILLALGMIFMLPFFNTDFYIESNNSYVLGLNLMIISVNNDYMFNKTYDMFINDHIYDDNPLIYLEIEGKQNYQTNTDPAQLRVSELNIYLSSLILNSNKTGIAMFDIRHNLRIQAGLDIGMIILICIILIFASISFTKDAYDLIIGPIENMIKKVSKISENPVRAAQQEEIEEFLVEMENQKNPKKKNTNKNSVMETVILEKIFVKIGALLALGFGEAGSDVITKSMKRLGGEIDPLVPGRKKFCIFGFCNIQDFGITTEVLQQDIVIFVNDIAKIVHSRVNQFSGSTNKNIGDAFFLVWKFPRESIYEDPETRESILDYNRYTNAWADMSLLSFIKIISELHKNDRILYYSEHFQLTKKIPGYKVQMGFALHQGWAIEGAIGSLFKIDASYLSPNVNLASRLEALTKQFGVQILVSDSFYSILSREVQVYLRKIDKIAVKGSNIPIEIFTFDLNIRFLVKSPKLNIIKTQLEIKNARAIEYLRKENLIESIKTQRFQISSLFIEDPDIRNMRKGITPIFLKKYDMALEHYFNGNWKEAYQAFLKAKENREDSDGPTEVLLEFIEEFGGIAPVGWPGYRVLKEK